MISWPKVIASLALLSPLLGWQAERRYQQLPRLDEVDDSPDVTALPAVSIIVPARNEAANLGRLLPSLGGLVYPGEVAVLVVDDNSTDGTADVARAQGVGVLSLVGLPAGWLGKPNACHQGAKVATSDWLLFTDADTTHTPDGLARVMRYALAHNLDGLSCHLAHITHGWLDSVTLLAAFAGLFAGLPRNHASLNGQYILLRRAVYEQSGGFAGVRAEPLEDLALGRQLQGLGFGVPMVQGAGVAGVAMYGSLGQLWRGMSRMGAGSLRFSGVGSLVTGLFITAMMTPLLVLGLVVGRLLPAGWLALTWGVVVLSLGRWSGRFARPGRVLLAPVGALLVQLAAVWGLLRRLTGRGVVWKGRMV